MSLLFNILIIVFLFSIFAVSHSLLAAFKVKERIAGQVGNKIAFYRLFYNVISILTFLTIYSLSPKPNIVIYDLQFPYDIITIGFQIIGVLGFFWAGSYVDLKEFLGITQIIRYLNGTYAADDLDENQEFIIFGPFKYSRHPIYFYSILLLGFRPSMDLFYLVFFICMVVYFYIGAMFEEQNLEKKYGKAYLEYKKNVPRLIPNIFRVKKIVAKNI